MPQDIEFELKDLDDERAQLTLTVGDTKYALVIGRVKPAEKKAPKKKPKEEPAKE